MLQKMVDVPEGSCQLTFRSDAVLLEYRYDDGVTQSVLCHIEWAQMEDLPWLCEKLGELKMKVFRPVAEALGVAYANRHLYEALIE